jgi:tripartite-type tricarboxylate transporter receptor subunit TctC
LKLRELYKGSAQAIQDLLGDSLQLGVDGVPATLPHIKSGRLRALASTGSTRAPLLPDVPTVAELGYKGFSGEGWGGIVMPKGAPAEVVTKLSTDLRKVMSDPVVQEKLVKAGLVVDNMPRDEWLAFTKADLVKWGDVVKRANIKVD